MRVPIPLGAYKRDDGFLPELRMRNLIVEPTEADDEKLVLLPRPGLKVLTALGSTPIAALFSDRGVFSGQTLALAGMTAYLGSGVLGTLSAPATIASRFCASALEMVFCAGGVLYRTDGATLSVPTLPTASPIVSVAYLDGYFFAVQQGSQRFYFSAVSNGSSWPALNFAAAESHAGALLDVMTINDQLVLLTQNSVEFWQPSGDMNLPFIRIDGLTYSKGALNTGAATYADNTLIWVGSDGIVYRRGAVPTRMSDHGIEDQISRSSAAYLFSFVWAGHTILVLTLDTLTYFYDFETKLWSEASTLGRVGWRAKCGAANGVNPVFGDSVTGNVLTFDPNTLVDVTDQIERRFTALIPNQAIIDNMTLDAQGGVGTEPNGDPIIVEVSISRDGSQQFSPFIPARLGRRGEYRQRAVWRRLGRYDMGAVLDFRTTDSSYFTFQSLRVNDDLSGRGV